MATSEVLFCFHGKDYLTFKDIRSECRRVLSKYPAGYEGNLSKDDSEWFVCLAKKRHYNSDVLFSKKIDSVEMYKRLGQSNNHLRFFYDDGSFLPFSWAKCCTSKKPCCKTERTNALRLAIVDQVIEELDRAFNNCLLVVCPMTLKVLCRDQVHVDHAVPCFADIVLLWLRQERIELSDVLVCDYEHGGKCMACDSQKTSWSKFHRNNAKLRVVCKQWNMKAGRHTKGEENYGRDETENGRAATEPELYSD